MPAPPSRRVFQFYPLEDRILLSADGLDSGEIVPDAELLDSLMAQMLDQQSPQAEGDLVETWEPFSEDAGETEGFIHHADSSRPLEVVFVDANVEDSQTLLQGLRGDRSNQTQWLVVQLSPDEDGIEQITGALSNLTGVDAIHVLSHGTEGAVKLGDVWLSMDNLDRYSGDLVRWRDALSSDADLLLYGCDLAASSEGQDLIEAIAALSDADVAASVDGTGGATYGANWELEYTVGLVQTSIAFSDAAVTQWEGLLDTFTVTNTNDSGAGSLRQAILDANALAGTDAIMFNISTSDGGYVDPDTTPGNGDEYWVIQPTSQLNTITDTVVLDATTQPGFADHPIIVLDGNVVGGSASGLVLSSTADTSEIRGFVIRDWSGNGIVVQSGSDNNTIAGNYIGRLTAAGVDSGVGTQNGGDGIAVQGNNTLIGGSSAADRNVISGNGDEGIDIDPGAVGTVIQGNYIGTTADGNTALPNGAAGVGNWGGILVGGDNTTIGGSGAGEGNVIAGNHSWGIIVESNNNLIQGNLIGVGADGTTALGNSGHGISVTDFAGGTNNLIGGTATGAGNMIAGNGLDGITVTGVASVSILGNETRNNGGLGIDLGDNGVTANDIDDGDTGANDLQNFPILTQAELAATDMTVSGTLDTDAFSSDYRIEFFGIPASQVDPTHGEGRYFLGTTTVTTDGSGDVSFSGVVLNGVTLFDGDYVTATATRIDDSGQIGIDDRLAFGSTSEFAANFAITMTNSAPSDLVIAGTREGGFTLNADGGNDTYLLADQGLAAPLTQFTVEAQFVATGAGTELPIISYNLPSGDELTVQTMASNVLELDFGSGGVLSSAIDYNAALQDGNRHTLSVSWDNTAGDWAIYIDGALIDSGTGLLTGGSIQTGGTLLFGLEQDSVGGSFESQEFFGGTLYDVRLFDDVRTAEEIAANYDNELPYDEAGLIANWRFDEVSADGVVTEVVSGNNLTLQHHSGTGFTSSSPELVLSIGENANSGSLVGTVSGIDFERDARISELLALDSELRYSAETGKFYKLINSSLTWTAAETDAGSQLLSGVGGELVSISSATEQDIVYSLVSAHGGDAWIGASDATVEGDFTWSGTGGQTFWSGGDSGSAINGQFQNFGGGEPNAANADRDYVNLDSAAGEWQVERSTNSQDYVAQWDADEVLDATDALTYAITAQTVAGAFTIDADSGQITVADGSLLDYEAAASHSVTVQVTDADGASYSEAFTIQIENTLEAEQSLPGSQSVNEDDVLAFSTANGNPVSVSDTMVGTDTPMQISLSVNDGVLTLSQTTGLTIVEGSDASGSMVVQGTESDLNAALEGMTFAPDPGFTGSVTLNMSTSLGSDMVGHYTFDGGNANDQSAGTSQDGSFVGNATTIVDGSFGEVLSLDGDGDSVQIAGFYGNSSNVTLAAWVNLTAADIEGADVISLGDNVGLRLDNPNGGSGVWGYYHDGTGWNNISTGEYLAGTQWHHVAYVFDDTNNTHTIYIDGNAVNSEATTASISYANGTQTVIGAHGDGDTLYDFNGMIEDARIYTRALSSDEVASLSRNLTETSGALAITVQPVNDAPVTSSIEGTPLAYTENGGTAAITSTLSLSDVDDTNLESAVVQITGNYATGQDVLSFTDQNGITGSWDAVTGTLTLTGSSSVANYEAALRSITYTNASDDPSTSLRTVSFTVNDGDANSNTLARDISITAVNDAPGIAAWYDDSWDYRKEIVVDAGQVSGDLAGFAILVDLSVDADLAAFAQIDADDIMFTSADGTTKLAHEIELYNAGTGQLIAWVNADVSAVDDTRLYMYYGNAGATNQQDAANVWDSNYQGVWHLNNSPNGTTNEIIDSSGNNNHGTTEGSMNSSDLVTTQIGTGLDFDEVDDLIRIGDSASFDSTAATATIEMWINWDNVADGDHQIVMASSNRFTTGAEDGYEWASQGTGNHFYYPEGGTDPNYVLGSSPYTNGVWHHVALTQDFSTRQVEIYVDGAAMSFTADTLSTTWTSLADPADWLWGGNPDRATRYFDGMMDEIRVSNVVRSQDWIQTTVNNQTDASAFVSLGAAEARDLALTDVNEDAGNPVGDTVATMLTSVGGDRITDADSGAVEGIAVIGVDDTNGTWQYDVGGGWTSFGSVSNTNAVLLDPSAQLRFVPDADYFGSSGDLRFRAWDTTDGNPSGTTGVDVSTNGGVTAYSSGTDTADLNVLAVNDAPVESAIEVGSLTYNENAGALSITSSLTLSDVDDTNLESAIIQISSNYTLGQDVLSFTDQNGISGSWDSAAGTLTLTGTSSVANYQAALRSVTYTNSSDNPSTATRTVALTVNDGEVNSNTQTRNITISASNDDPIGTGLPTDIAVTEDILSNVDLSSVNLSDVDAGGGDLTVTLSTSTGGNLSAASGGGVTVGGSGSASLTLTGTLADLNTYLDTASNVQYLHGITNTFGNDVDTISVTVNDGGNTGSGGGTDQSLGTVNVDIVAVNDSPTLAINNGLTVNEGDANTTITSGMLESADVDDSGSGLTYTVTDEVDNGMLTLAGFGTLNAGDSFTQADIDSGNVTYSHDDSETTFDSFGFVLADGGENGSGSVSGTFAITVVPTNDQTIGPISDTDLAVDTVAENSVIGTPVGVTALAVDGDLGDSVSYSLDDDAGGRFAIDGASGLVSVSGALDFEAAASENITVRATSSDGSNASLVISISVTDVNEAPTAVGESFAVQPGTTLSVGGSGVIFNDSDIDGDSLALILVAPPSDGTLSLQPNGTFTYTPNPSFFGTDSFFYQLTDGTLTSNTVEATLEVSLAIPAGAGGTTIPISDPSDPSDPSPQSADPTDPPFDPSDPTDPSDPSDSLTEDSSDPSTDDPAEASNDPPTDTSTAVAAVAPPPPPTSPPTPSTSDAPAGDEAVSAGAGRLAGLGIAESDQPLFALLGSSNQASGLVMTYSPELEQLERMLRQDLEQAIVWSQWDDSHQDEETPVTVYVGIAGAGMSVFSIGYVFWALRGGALVTVFASSLPAWRFIDPVAMLSAYRSSKVVGEDRVDSMLG